MHEFLNSRSVHRELVLLKCCRLPSAIGTAETNVIYQPKWFCLFAEGVI